MSSDKDFRPSYYALVYSMLKDVALDCGWALAVHGSLASDLDLVAVAWEDDSKPLYKLLAAFADKLKGTAFGYVWNGPHMAGANREVWTLSLERDVYLDLNVFDNRKGK